MSYAISSNVIPGYHFKLELVLAQFKTNESMYVVGSKVLTNSDVTDDDVTLSHTVPRLVSVLMDCAYLIYTDDNEAKNENVEYVVFYPKSIESRPNPTLLIVDVLQAASDFASIGASLISFGLSTRATIEAVTWED